VRLAMRAARKVIDRIVDGLKFHSERERPINSEWLASRLKSARWLAENSFSREGRCPPKSLPVHHNGPFAVFAIFFDDRNGLRRLEFVLFDQRRVSFSIGMNGPAQARRDVSFQ
jgi:hypothetical protein